METGCLPPDTPPQQVAPHRGGGVLWLPDVITAYGYLLAESIGNRSSPWNASRDAKGLHPPSGPSQAVPGPLQRFLPLYSSYDPALCR